MALKGFGWKDGYGHGAMAGDGEDGGSFFRAPTTGAAGSHVPSQELGKLYLFLWSLEYDKGLLSFEPTMTRILQPKTGLLLG